MRRVAVDAAPAALLPGATAAPTAAAHEGDDGGREECESADRGPDGGASGLVAGPVSRHRPELIGGAPRARRGGVAVGSGSVGARSGSPWRNGAVVREWACTFRPGRR